MLKQSTRNKNTPKSVLESLKVLRDEVLGLYLPKQVPVIYEIPEPFEFYRNYVAPNIPVLVKGGIKNWKAVKKWNKEYFCEKIKNKPISVAVTPNGYADAITETVIKGEPQEVFVMPDEKLMTISEFYDKLDETFQNSDTKSKITKGIYYIQKQNSNLTEEFPELLSDIDENLLWASQSLQSQPTAINLWIGDQRAITSLHKDPFENIYCVISGYKEFILLPPTDRPWLPYKTLPIAKYKEKSPGIFDINIFKSEELLKSSDLDSLNGESETGLQKVPWISLDPCCPDYKKYPLYKNASPLHVKVEAGDALYLPSLWFHHVKQSHKCVAVNYWYDMNLDIKYAYFQLLEKLSKYLDVSGI